MLKVVVLTVIISSLHIIAISIFSVDLDVVTRILAVRIRCTKADQRVGVCVSLTLIVGILAPSFASPAPTLI